MSTQTTPERAQAQANGSAVTLVSPDRRQTGRAPGPSAPARAGRGFTRRSAAGDVVMAYVGTQAARLKALDPLVRENAPDSVHQMRVAARRLRSTLQAYPAILPKPATQHLRAELKWLGDLLGEARDDEVLSAYLMDRLASLPAEQVLGPAQARVRAHYAPREASAREALLEALNSARYHRLVAELDQLIADPPLTAASAEPAGKVLPRAIGRAHRRTRRRIHQAQRIAPGAGRDVALHETRKAAKRARYAAEAAQPALGKNARRFARGMNAVQSALGDHHDAVNARAAAREIGVRAHLAGENAFTFGLLSERAAHDATAFEAKALRAWKHAKRRKGRRQPGL
jgi:CHAD domain-containing protein